MRTFRIGVVGIVLIGVFADFARFAIRRAPESWKRKILPGYGES